MNDPKEDLEKIYEILGDGVESWENYEKDPRNKSYREDWMYYSIETDEMIEIFKIIKKYRTPKPTWITMNRFDYEKIPEYMIKMMVDYIEKGKPMCGFLEAVFANDLHAAVGRADDETVALIPNYVCWVMRFAPIWCQGSYERIKDWVLNKGRSNE